MRSALSLAVALFASLACTSTPKGEQAARSPAAGGQDGGGSELRGVVVPVEPAALALWPEAYAGELVVLEALPHGTLVAQDDVVARLDPRALEQQLADARLELDSARVEHAGLVAKNDVAGEAAASQLARTEAGLDRARRALAGFEAVERAFERRSDALALLREQDGVDDQLDELAQLEAMYAADELVDATEEIVLKRSRRRLARARAWNELSQDQRDHRVELSDALELESRREDVAREEEGLAHLRATAAVEARARAGAEARSAADLAQKETRLARLERDRELLTLRAPRAGVLLHGSARDLRSGGAPKRVERGGTLAARADVLLVADPARLAVALDVPESQRAGLADGAAVTVRPLALSGVELRGTLALAALPAVAKGEEGAFEATVALDGTAPGLVCGMHVVVAAAGARR